MSHHFLFVTPYYTPLIGGTTAFLEAMVRRLVAVGHRVTVLTTNARNASDFWRPPERQRAVSPIWDRAIESPGPAGAAVERLPLFYPRPAPYAFAVARRAGHWLRRTRLPPHIVRSVQGRLMSWMPPLRGLMPALARLIADADLVQAEDSSWDGLFVQAAAMACRLDKPFVAHPLMHLGDAGVRAHFQMLHQVDAYRQASAVLALSRREADEYMLLGTPAEHVHVIPMGIDPDEAADWSAMPPDAFLREHALVGPIVAFLGANTYDKGAFTLALAVGELNRAGLAVTLVCAGPESAGLLDFLDRQPAALRAVLRERVRVLGVVDETVKHRLLAACNLLALPSQVDTFGIVLLEAWLHGKPVVGAAAGGIPEVIRDGQTGLLIPFGDAGALAAAIRRLVEAPDWARQLGQAGRERVLHEYTWDRTFRILERIYAGLLRQ